MIIRNLISLFPTYYAMYWDVKRQKRFVQAVIEPEIASARSGNDGTLDEEDFQKIRSYYGFGVPAIVGEGICTLHGRQMSSRERTASTYQGALTGLYDDFFDKTRLDHKDIKRMMLQPAEYKANSSLEKLFIHFLNSVHAHLDNKLYFSESFNKVFEVQIETEKQLQTDFPLDAIKQITFKKGGLSLLFYRSIFKEKLYDGEEEALYQVGALMQLGNDIFDVHKDQAQKIRTLPTSCSHIDDVRKIFEGQLANTIMLLEQSDFPESNKKNYISKLILGTSRCYVCLDQLDKLEKKTAGVFTPSAYTRKEMICDMDRPANILRSIRYYLTYKF